MTDHQPITIPFIIRGKRHESPDYLYSHSSGIQFFYPNPRPLLDEIVLKDPVQLQSDFRSIRVKEIIRFLSEVGKLLNFQANANLRKACEFSTAFSALTPSIIKANYELLPVVFSKFALTALVENEIGAKYLDGWVDLPYSAQLAKVRAYGTRMLHYLSGNAPVVAALSIARASLVKSDNILKLPVNDPLTSTIILEAMIDVDQNHPIVKHFSAVFWSNANQGVDFEHELVNPLYIDTAVSWGGALGGVNSTTGHSSLADSGVRVLALGPKVSMSIIASESLQPDRLAETAARGAKDSSAFNAQSCGSSRYQFVQCDENTAIEYGKALYKAMQNQDPAHSTKPRRFPESMVSSLSAIRDSGFFEVIGGEEGEGAVVISLLGEITDFTPTDKVVNVIPFDRTEDVIRQIPASVQTIGISPPHFREEMRDSLVSRGACRFVDLGHTVDYAVGGPFNSRTILHEMCRWILDERQPTTPFFYLLKAMQIATHKFAGGL